MERVAWAISGVGFMVLLSALFFLDTKEKSANIESNAPVPRQQAMIIRSPAFNHEEAIPSKYTCEGEDTSPPLAFDNIPEQATSLVLIVDDPDAPMGTWNHWIQYDIPVTQTRIGEGESPGGQSGTNSWGKLGYGGPCPPSGEHRYLFKLYALDTALQLEGGVDKDALQTAMQGHIIESATLMGRYQKSG